MSCSNDSAIGIKNVSGNEQFFQGHFPDHPVMPGVLIIEAMAQTAAVLVVETLGPDAAGKLVYFMTIEGAKFRRPVVPGDQLRLLVVKERRRAMSGSSTAPATVDGVSVAEATFSAMIMDRQPPRPSNAGETIRVWRGQPCRRMVRNRPRDVPMVRTALPDDPALTIHPTAIVAGGARIAPDATIGPWCSVGPDAEIGPGATLVSHVVVDGHTSIGSGAVLFPFCTVGLAPQDLKYKGEPTRCEIGPRTPDPRALHDPPGHRHRVRASPGWGGLPADGRGPRRA